MDLLPAETVDHIVQSMPVCDQLRFAMCNKWYYDAFYSQQLAHRSRFMKCLDTIKRQCYETGYSRGMTQSWRDNNRITLSIYESENRVVCHSLNYYGRHCKCIRGVSYIMVNNKWTCCDTPPTRVICCDCIVKIQLYTKHIAKDLGL